MATLLTRKEELKATRVCGGACTMPKEIGDWCSHANACLTCRYFRADAKDKSYFKSEKSHLLDIINDQESQASELQEDGRNRLAEITNKRIIKNKEVVKNIDNILNTIEQSSIYAGSERQFNKEGLPNE